MNPHIRYTGDNPLKGEGLLAVVAVTCRQHCPSLAISDVWQITTEAEKLPKLAAQMDLIEARIKAASQ